MIQRFGGVDPEGLHLQTFESTISYELSDQVIRSGSDFWAGALSTTTTQYEKFWRTRVSEILTFLTF